MMRVGKDTLHFLGESGPLMLVAVVGNVGSTPREAGAMMLVSQRHIWGTIGGGNLEYEVCRRARREIDLACHAKDAELPDQTEKSTVIRFPLGPGLGQCCGGAVDVAFCLLAENDKAALSDLIETALSRPIDKTASANWLVISLMTGRMSLANRKNIENRHSRSDQSFEDAIKMPDEHLWPDGLGGIVEAGSDKWLFLRLDRGAVPVWIFGAGHVGQALAQALSALPFDLTLVDSREDFVADVALKGFHAIQSDLPQEEIEDIPSGAFVLILTHNHAQDFDICRMALLRDDLGYVGMIGSQTKKARFMRRLSDRGFGVNILDKLICPIGVSGISGKEPEVIAASVAAQLLIFREKHQFDQIDLVSAGNV